MLLWQNDGTPRSTAFDDVYFSAQDGLAESRHVFLSGNHLPERLQTSERFVVGETGFGTGLNLLALWQLWDTIAPPGAVLVYDSVEAFPLTVADLARAHANWPELAGFSKQLCDAWPPAPTGTITLQWGSLHLRVHCGEAALCLPDFPEPVDAWFLDGFSPAKNPAMWSDEVIQCLANRSQPGTTFATFTVARAVRDRLMAHGFRVEKTRGFGRKRDMLRGVFRSCCPSPAGEARRVVLRAPQRSVLDIHEQRSAGKLPFAARQTGIGQELLKP